MLLFHYGGREDLSFVLSYLYKLVPIMVRGFSAPLSRIIFVNRRFFFRELQGTFSYGVLSVISKRVVVKYSEIDNTWIFCYILEIKIFCINVCLTNRLVYWNVTSAPIKVLQIEQPENALL